MNLQNIVDTANALNDRYNASSAWRYKLGNAAVAALIFVLIVSRFTAFARQVFVTEKRR